MVKVNDMNILVTGAKGMVGTALCNNLKNIQDGKNRTRPGITIEEIYEYDIGSTIEQLDAWCKKTDFVFHLAGVNRPENPEDFVEGNFGFASELLDTLKKHNNKAPIMFSSSIQATFSGRFGNSEYKGRGRSVLQLQGRNRRKSGCLSFPQSDGALQTEI